MKRRHLGTNPLHGAFRREGVLDLFNIKKEKPSVPPRIEKEDENLSKPPSTKGDEG
ncbi:MAG: hypothetical protein JW950_04280 [Deltaproteobacteria bacterium]|nr:hypothetical protein [Deltaproteobacteria bacterium]